MRSGALWGRMERLAFTVWLAASAGACTSWQTVNVSPDQVIAEHHPTKLRVTQRDGSRVELENPRTDGDTLLGTVQAATVTVQNQNQYGQTSTAPGDTVTQARIPFNDAVRIERRHVSAGKTTGLVVGIMAVGAVVAGGIALASWDCCLGSWGQ